ncbi:MAG: hypothetical protein ACNA8P_03910 [Phycisphaerales bacterium]
MRDESERHDPDLELASQYDDLYDSEGNYIGPDRRMPSIGPEARGFKGTVDPRSGLDRRDTSNSETGLERRRGPGRRRTDFTRAAEEGEMTPEQFLFIMAIDEFKRANGKTFPSWTDVLEVMRLLGYRKTCPSQLNLPSTDDWTEKHDAPAGVRDKPGHRMAG